MCQIGTYRYGSMCGLEGEKMDNVKSVAWGYVPMTPTNVSTGLEPDLITRHHQETARKHREIEEALRSRQLRQYQEAQWFHQEMWRDTNKSKGRTMFDMAEIKYDNYATVDQLAVAEAYFGMIIDRIKANGREVPERLVEILAKITRDINCRQRDEFSKKLKQLRAEKKELQSREEKLKDVDAKIADLEKKIGSFA